MVDYYCVKCNYRFTAPRGKKLPLRCSYCDSRGTFKRVKSAQDLLNEVVSDTSQKEERDEHIGKF